MARQYIDIDSSVGDKFYYKDPGKTILHREDGPAVEQINGQYEAWWLNGERHRLDGPAVRYDDGTDQWYVNGEFIFETDRSGDVVGTLP